MTAIAPISLVENCSNENCPVISIVHAQYLHWGMLEVLKGQEWKYSKIDTHLNGLSKSTDVVDLHEGHKV